VFQGTDVNERILQIAVACGIAAGTIVTLALFLDIVVETAAARRTAIAAVPASVIASTSTPSVTAGRDTGDTLSDGDPDKDVVPKINGNNDTDTDTDTIQNKDAETDENDDAKGADEDATADASETAIAKSESVVSSVANQAKTPAKPLKLTPVGVPPAPPPVPSMGPAPQQAAAGSGPDLRLDLPVRCTPNKDCWVVNYLDLDPSKGVRDYTCGKASYDGHKGTDIAIRGMETMRRGVAVIAAAPGIVSSSRNNMPDIDFKKVGSDRSGRPGMRQWSQRRPSRRMDDALLSHAQGQYHGGAG
jgi:hypothetical protein